nr:hypothetical protein [uncultured bacterium]
MSIESNAKIVSVVGGCRRSGRWIVPAETNMMTLFGRAVIDLREADTTAEQLEFTCFSVFANITFLVPEGAEVRPSGMAILGSSRSVVPTSDVVCHLPPMSVDATTIFGRIRIRTTDHDPEDGEKVSFWKRFRRDATPPLADAEDANPTDGVDFRDTPAPPTQTPAPAEPAAPAVAAPAANLDALGQPQAGIDNNPGVDAASTDQASAGGIAQPLPDGTLSDRPKAFGDELEHPPLESAAVDPKASATPLDTPTIPADDLSARIAPLPDPAASPIEGIEAPDDISEIDDVDVAENDAHTVPANDTATSSTDAPEGH